MVKEMICDICNSQTSVRHGIDIRQSVWCCPKCFGIYNSIHKHYREKGYSKDRCITILRRVVEKQKLLGKWMEKKA